MIPMRENPQVAIVGAGPAGLSAAAVLARCGARVTAYDENDRPGGQLFKQIHKFFGSGHHGAGVRGVELGRQLLAECEAAGVEICLSHTVYGIFPGGRLGVTHAGYSRIIRAEKILIATGATEKALAFPGWDLPGVMGAGAAQTMVNLNRVLPGRRIIMVGSGNVGLVVGFQLLQAGAHLAAVVEAKSQISGYAVHANKLMRAGVPILTGHTVLEARGRDSVEEVTIGRVDERYRHIPGTERTIEADTVCLAVGLTPSIELLRMANVGLTHLPPMGGYLPLHSGTLCTTNPDIYVAGDVAGIEEASTAMEEGRLAGTAIAAALGLLENIQRADLNPFEQAQGMKDVMVLWDCTQAEAAKRLGMAQPTLANKLRLLQLNADQRQFVLDNNLTERHARAVLRLPENRRSEALINIAKRRMNARQTDLYIEQLLNTPAKGRHRVSMVKDVRIFVNTIDHAIRLMTDNGVPATAHREEKDGYIEYTVRIPTAAAER